MDIILKKNDIYTAAADGWSADGGGVCHIGGRAVFVPGIIPGETWEIKILKVSAAAVYGKGLRLLDPSPDRVLPGCPHFGVCGGCDTRHISYEAELRFKLGRVNDALRHVGGIDFAVTEIIPAGSQERYRNKGIFAVGELDGRAVSGFYREHSHDIIPVASCPIQTVLADRAAAAVTDWMNKNRIRPYDEATGRGTVRHIFVRRAVKTPDAVLCVVTARGFGGLTPDFVEAVRGACPELTGIVLNVNKTRGNSVLSGDFYTLWGSETMRDMLSGFSFEIAPQAFYQVNPPQAEKLYQRAVEYAGLTGSETVLDLYCGAGTISLCLARQAKQVVGAEIVPEAVQNAEKNAAANHVGNVSFICADAAQAANELAARNVRPDVVVVDPPRKGMYPEAAEAVAGMAPARVVYVSCNPATLARDIKLFTSLGYGLSAAAAVDMFPRTSHVETVVLMSRVENQP
jgi:23S rRNA (uracil1939-C5)-methyltransferase